jgi:alpha-maltose-1-phosphate synthase
MRAIFVNSGILGHASVAKVIRQSLAEHADIDAIQIDLSANLSVRERIIRRMMCWGPSAPGSVAGAITLARWRHELHAGVLGASRIRVAERTGAADVLHFHTQATAYASIARMRRTPSIVSIDITQGRAAEEAPSAALRLAYGASAHRDRRVFRVARAIIATSRWAADDLVASLPECASRIHVWPYPVPLAGFERAWIDARHVRALRGDPVRLLFMGGDFPRKGGPQLLEAWNAADLTGRATLRLVTDWTLDKSALPAGVDVQNGVRAYTSEWFACWRDADIFVMPTRGEAFGMVFQEAAAAGLPSVGTRLNAIPEIVVEGSTGLLVRPGDLSGIGAALRRLIDAPELRRTFGAAARDRAETAFSPRDYGARLVDLLYEVTRGTRVEVT